MKHEEFCQLFNVYETTVRNLLQFPSRHTQEQKDGARVAIIRAWQAARTPAADSSAGASGDAIYQIRLKLETRYRDVERSEYFKINNIYYDRRIVYAAPVAVDSSARDALTDEEREAAVEAYDRTYSSMDRGFSMKADSIEAAYNAIRALKALPPA